MKKMFLLLLLPIAVRAQPTFEAFKKYPYPTQLTTSANGQKIAWAFEEEGKRNVYVAEGPAFDPKKLTNYDLDDGQEITSLSITNDGQWVVFVRGGEHGSNWESSNPVNPTSMVSGAKVQIASIPFSGGDVKYLTEADGPLLAPDSRSVAFVRGGQVFSIAVDGSSAAKALFTARGSISNLQWSPDGTQLLFTSNRSDHSIIGIYSSGAEKLSWVAPSYHRDQSPRWSPDGKRIVFIRTPGSGGAPDSLLGRRHNPWAIFVADVSTGNASKIWTAPTTLQGSVPNTQGGYNLHWAAKDRIVFLSYMDGWPHLYSVSPAGGQPILLTPGNFMCEHIKLSNDKQRIFFSANSGPDPLDLDRRHIAMVSVDKADMQVLSPGTGIEWSPVQIGNTNMLTMLGATLNRPPLPGIMDLQNKRIMWLGAEKIPAAFPLGSLVTPTKVTFKAADGVLVHADLFMPKDGPSKKPAIVYVHGGPPRQMLLGWHYSDYYATAYAANQYLASQGFVVLAVNYRLGIGYGFDFHQPANGGRTGASEYQDIVAAGEWLKKQTYVDADKIGIYGGSYGGYLTALALARNSDLFAAGVDIHGVHDWVTDRPVFFGREMRYEKVPDLEDAIRIAWRSSPVSSISTWRSPVLIIHGDDDRNVQFSQSTDLVRRLEKQGVPHETMVIVDDTHHWMKHTNALKVYEAMADFFRRKLK
ncbi:MAG TPA: prolyl oligopeptidase family serine peptidase [Phnomibacter sp.]|nr:prolyl oligopeptidase family serine peptidase [Phnomibacter sp.]